MDSKIEYRFGVNNINTFCYSHITILIAESKGDPQHPLIQL